MKARVGKIARLPSAIREALNRALEQGRSGPRLLDWLNGLPEVQRILCEQFKGQPISKQNLSCWRNGGFPEWLQQKDRQRHVERLMQNPLDSATGADAVHKGFRRVMAAELAWALDELNNLSDRDERWQWLQRISRELARLQNAHIRDRRDELFERQLTKGLPPHPGPIPQGEEGGWSLSGLTNQSEKWPKSSKVKPSQSEKNY